MFILDCIKSILYVFMPLLPILVYLIFCSKNFVEWVEHVTGLKLIAIDIGFEDDMVDNFFGFIPTPTFHLLVDGLFMIAFIIALVYRYYFGFYENIFFAVFFLPLIYASFILSLRRNTFHPNGVPTLSGYVETNDKYYSYNTYQMMSTCVGFFPTACGGVFLVIGITPLIFLWGLFMQTIVLFPDVMGKIVPLDFKKWEGVIFLLLFSIPSWVISFYVAGLFVTY